MFINNSSMILVWICLCIHSHLNFIKEAFKGIRQINANFFFIQKNTMSSKVTISTISVGSFKTTIGAGFACATCAGQKDVGLRWFM
jgi:hypothetical protein